MWGNFFFLFYFGFGKNNSDFSQETFTDVMSEGTGRLVWILVSLFVLKAKNSAFFLDMCGEQRKMHLFQNSFLFAFSFLLLFLSFLGHALLGHPQCHGLPLELELWT